MQNPNKLDRINYCQYSAFGDPFSLVASCSLSRDFRVLVSTCLFSMACVLHLSIKYWFVKGPYNHTGSFLFPMYTRKITIRVFNAYAGK